MTVPSGGHRYDSSAPGLSDQNPNAFTPPGTSNTANRSGLLSPGPLDIVSIPTKGLRIARPGDMADVGTSCGNGYFSVDCITSFPDQPFKLNGICQVNRDSAVGRVGGAFTQVNKNLWRTDFARENRGSVRQLESFSDNISDSMLSARNLKRGEAQWVESWDYSGGLCLLLMRPGAAPFMAPRASYTWSDQQQYRALMSKEEARKTSDAYNQIGDKSFLQQGEHKAKIVLGSNVRQRITDVHSFPRGEALENRAERNFEMGAQFSWYNSVVSVLGFQGQEYFTHAQKQDSDTARILLSATNKRGWRSDGVACVGLRGYRRSAITDSYQEHADYSDTPEGRADLKQAEPSFRAKPMPPMDRDAAAKACNTPLGVDSRHARRTGGMRTQEVSVESGVNWRFNLVPNRPGFWTFLSRDHRRASRLEFVFNNESGPNKAVERIIDTRRTNREYCGKLPTVHEVTAAEEWFAGEEKTDSALQKMRFVSQWHAQSPRTPEQLNSVIDYYNELFGTSRARLSTMPGTPKATRRMKIELDFSRDQVESLPVHFADKARLADMATNSHLSDNDIAPLVAVFAKDASLETRCTALRKFAATHGIRGMAFLHRLSGGTAATLNISADEEIFSNVTKHCAKILSRYRAPLDSETKLSDLQDRLYHITDALRALQHAYTCIEQDSMLSDDKRILHLAQLQQQEAELRALYDVGNDDQLRKKLHQALTDVWFPTQQDCEFAAVFQKVSDLDPVSEMRIDDEKSAKQFLSKYDESIQTLRRVAIGTENNILFTEQQRKRHLEHVRQAIDSIEKNFLERREGSCPIAKQYLHRPYQTCGTYWFATWRGWRFFWLTFDSRELVDRLNFWSNNTLLTTAR